MRQGIGGILAIHPALFRRVTPWKKRDTPLLQGEGWVQNLLGKLFSCFLSAQPSAKRKQTRYQSGAK